MNSINLSITRTEEDWFAIEVPENFLEKAIECFLKNCPQEAPVYLQNKAQRDGKGRFHITVITPPELAELARDGRSPKPADYEYKQFKIEIKGIGCASSPLTKVYFAVIQSPDLFVFRASYGLTSKFHPHCTLGFSSDDIHDVAKDKVLWKV